MIYEGNMSVEY